MLREVAKQTECQTDQVLCAAYLSKAYWLQGDRAEAKCWMDKARKINPEHVVVKRLENEQAGATILPSSPPAQSPVIDNLKA